MTDEKTDNELTDIDELLEASPLAEKFVDVSRWIKGKKIHMVELDAESMLRWTDENNENTDNMKHAGMRLGIASLVDRGGNRYSPEKQQELFASFKKHGAALVNLISREGLDLNGVSKKAREEVKNESSETTPGASLTVLH
jgi:dissimilatory sulfite reductase (desulfoviridin) alpha/beta subunit